MVVFLTAYYVLFLQCLFRTKMPGGTKDLHLAKSVSELNKLAERVTGADTGNPRM